MEYQADYTASLLNNSYVFQSISGKNTNFGAIVQDMPFFYRSNATKSRGNLCVHAGGEITYASPVKFTQSALPYTILLFVTAGEATISYHDHPIDLTKNDILLLPSEAELQFSSTLTPFTYTIFYLSGTVCEDFCPVLFGMQDYYKKNHNPDSILFRLLPSISGQLASTDPVSTLHLSAVLNLTFSSLTDDRVKDDSISRLPKHVALMKQIYDTDFKNPHPLEELEDTIGINKYRLCRDFSQYIGYTPVKYLTQVRITEAKHLLRFSNLTIHEVGSAVGIDNTTHFINLFKKNTGITPLRFRQNHSH